MGLSYGVGACDLVSAKTLASSIAATMRSTSMASFSRHPGAHAVRSGVAAGSAIRPLQDLCAESIDAAVAFGDVVKLVAVVGAKVDGLGEDSDRFAQP